MPIASAITAFWKHNEGIGVTRADHFTANPLVPRRRPGGCTADFCINSNTSATPDQYSKARYSRITVFKNKCLTQAEVEALALDVTWGNAAYTGATAHWKCREATSSSNFTMTDENGGTSNLTAIAGGGTPINSVAGPFGAANDALQFGSGGNNRASTSTLTNVQHVAGEHYSIGGFVLIDAHPTVGAPGDKQGVFFGQHKLDANNIGIVIYEYAWNTSGHRYLNCDCGNGPTDTNLAGNAVNDGAVALVTAQWYYIAATFNATTNVLTVYKIPVGGATTLNAFTLTAAVDSIAGKIGNASKLQSVPQWVEGTSGYDVARTSPLEVTSPTTALSGTPTKISHGAFMFFNNVTTTATIISYGFNSTTNAMFFAFQVSGGLIYFLVGNGVTSFQYASKAISTGQWYSIVGMFNSAGDNKPHIYVNEVEGTSNGTAGFTVAIPAGATFRVGGCQNDTQQPQCYVDLQWHAPNYAVDATDLAFINNGGNGWEPTGMVLRRRRPHRSLLTR